MSIELGVEKGLDGFSRMVTKSLINGLTVSYVEDNRKKNFGLCSVIADRTGVKISGNITLSNMIESDAFCQFVLQANRLSYLLQLSQGRETPEIEELLDA